MIKAIEGLLPRGQSFCIVEEEMLFLGKDWTVKEVHRFIQNIAVCHLTFSLSKRDVKLFLAFLNIGDANEKEEEEVNEKNKTCDESVLLNETCDEGILLFINDYVSFRPECYPSDFANAFINRKIRQPRKVEVIAFLERQIDNFQKSIDGNKIDQRNKSHDIVAGAENAKVNEGAMIEVFIPKVAQVHPEYTLSNFKNDFFVLTEQYPTMAQTANFLQAQCENVDGGLDCLALIKASAIDPNEKAGGSKNESITFMALLATVHSRYYFDEFKADFYILMGRMPTKKQMMQFWSMRSFAVKQLKQ